jgi:hypothetical protein
VHIKKDLGFTALRSTLSKRLRESKDNRQNGKVKHSLHDCFMSSFAMMYFQDSSLLSFQRRMQEVNQRNNLMTMFNVSNIPSETQLRDVLDETPSDRIEDVFSDYFFQLQRGKHLEGYQFMPGKYLATLDGSEYFSSGKIHCPGCLIKASKKSGDTRYAHQILQASIVHPGKKQIIPLAPEAIKNVDGTDKQDCEINAGKRLIRKIRETHPRLGLIIVGDGLYSKQPFIEDTAALGMSFILVAKPDDHKIMMEWISEQRQLKEVFRLEFKDQKGRQHVYEWINGVPLNGNQNSVGVNYFEYRLTVGEKTTYKNSWVTDIVINRDNVTILVSGGRARWKIENEGFNTLKNHGYHLDHNFGHGDKNLSMNFFLLNMLAFFMHQILELTDLLYQSCRARFSSRTEYWNQLRCTVRIILFESWEDLLRLVTSPSTARPP